MTQLVKMSVSVGGDAYLEQIPFLRGDDNPEFSERDSAVLDKHREQTGHSRLALTVLAVGDLSKLRPFLAMYCLGPL